MAISWLSALKVVPWDKVLEHAPGVLEKARGFIDKHRTGRVDAPTELVQLAQQQMAQALAELAEQNAALIAAVRRLQVRLREHWAGFGFLRLWGCAIREVKKSASTESDLIAGAKDFMNTTSTRLLGTYLGKDCSSETIPCEIKTLLLWSI